MDRDAELLDRLANRAEKARRERYRAEARAGRRYGSERYVTLPRWVKPLLPAVAGAAGCRPEVSAAFKTGFFCRNPPHRRPPDNSPEILIAGSPTW